MNSNSMELFNTTIGSSSLNVLTVLYFLIASITTFDMRINQSIKQGSNQIPLPKWVGIFYWLLWGFWLLIFFLNWVYALILFALKFVLKVLPVLETVGYIFMAPFNPNKK
jgi:hypothetical protein